MDQPFDAIPVNDAAATTPAIPKTTKNKSLPKFSYPSITVAWTALFCDYCLLTMAVPIFPQLGRSESETGLLFSMKALLQVCSAPFVARYVDSYELEPVILGLVIEAISCLTFAFTENYTWWCIARAISGISSSAVISSSFLHVQRQFVGQNELLGHAMSICATGIISGVTMGPPLGGLLYGIDKMLPFFVLIGFIICAAILAFRLQVKMYGGFAKAKNPNSSKTGDVVAVAETSDMVWARAKKLLADKHIMCCLVALFCANAAIACLESTFGHYMMDTFDFSVADVGLLYVIGAIPSVIGSKISGGLGNKHGRWVVIMAGMFMQGAFFALGPKDNFPVELVSLIGLGLGMGLVDGCAPAMLGQVSEMSHGGTGIVYTLNTMAVQIGFVFGPIIGSVIMEHHGFGVMSIVLGGFMMVVSPVMLVNRKVGGGELEEQQEEEEEEEKKLADNKVEHLL